ncbi:hypothetical protein [Natronolimnohabitans innermongolicus]|uniref:Twin-arginine translocation signal domain-containing protein n=1 Tax=Natronolimnohabitans innermongolicus JCM 12255 TaxID=1227499 RepID=L9X1I5_9EURY|nr:hypothetical protein [Natronolimnohabitans innermongolicus]ELY55624.1 hypothetical protein C493_10992 [Natronolimnohabitans innermongolicus JCM 12255]
MPSRRSFLRTGALAGAGTLAAIVALPSPPDATPLDRTVEASEVPPSIAEWTDEPITGETDSPMVRYQYRPIDDVDTSDFDAFVATAPINVVLVPDADTDAAGLERVMTVLDDEGWLRDPEEYTRYAWDREASEFVRQQATAAETYYGTSGRLHVRCWSFEGIVSMQAHEDTGARPKHGIASYERGLEAMETAFDAAGWNVSPAAIDLDNAQRDYDGTAPVITEGDR